MPVNRAATRATGLVRTAITLPFRTGNRGCHPIYAGVGGH